MMSTLQAHCELIPKQLVTVRFSVTVPTLGRATLLPMLTELERQLTDADEVLVRADGLAAGLLAPDLLIEFRKSRKHEQPYKTGYTVSTSNAKDWGHTVRNELLELTQGTHLLFMDDDDKYRDGALSLVRSKVAEAPDRPHMFRMKLEGHGPLIWKIREVRMANVSGQMFVVPNDKGKLGRWSEKYHGDYDFIESTLALYPPGALVWHPEVVCDRNWFSGKASEGDPTQGR